VLDEQGEVLEIIGVGRDITERKQLEDQLRHSQKMQAVGQLAGGIAHDFNNIIHAMLGFLSFALDEAPEGTTLRDDLLKVKKSAERADSLTKQLLAFSRRQVIEVVDLDLNELISETLDMLRRLLSEAIVLEFHAGDQLGAVRADPQQIEQVLMNLCVNARDAIGKTGRIDISTRKEELDLSFCAAHPTASPGPHIVLEVSDDGVGMSEETLEQIFEPFFTTKAVGAGTGLGLASVYGIVEQHHGVISVKSAVDQGTTVTVYLPRAVGLDTVVHRDEGVEHVEPGTETILVAEDDPEVCTLAKRILSEAGYRVVCATDGLEAAQIFEASSDEIDLVLTDVVMPQVNGRELHEWVMTLRDGVPVIFMSGYAGEELDLEGEVDLLVKPFDRESLLERVRSMLDG
jgi:nitrogen-specific signal transduction histidine kinase